MHTYPHHQGKSIFPQVNPRKSERNRAVERPGERPWFPLRSQSPPTGRSGCGSTSCYSRCRHPGRGAVPGALLVLQRGRALAGPAPTMPSGLPKLGAVAQPLPPCGPAIEALRAIHPHLHGVSAEDLAAMMESLEENAPSRLGAGRRHRGSARAPPAGLAELGPPHVQWSAVSFRERLGCRLAVFLGTDL